MRDFTDEEIFEIAYSNGFPLDETEVVLSGLGERDRQVNVGEYPCGESLLQFARALLARAGSSE